MAGSSWHDAILEFWFAELTPKDWYSGGAEVDDKIRDRFLDTYRALAARTPPETGSDAGAALAAIIAFDQFPRNLFRRKPEAFATDAQALTIARAALDNGFDAALPPERRQFMYMPFMHSEVLADQERAVTLFKSLGNEEGIKYAIEHRDIVARFGRFPHRNRALGRKSTPAELEFLEQHGGFGQ